MREQAFLNAGLTIQLTDQRDPENLQGETMCYEGGIRQLRARTTVLGRRFRMP